MDNDYRDPMIEEITRDVQFNGVGVVCACALSLVGAVAVVASTAALAPDSIGWLALFGILGGILLLASANRLVKRSMRGFDAVTRPLVFAVLPCFIVLGIIPALNLELPQWASLTVFVAAGWYGVALVIADRIKRHRHHTRTMEEQEKTP